MEILNTIKEYVSKVHSKLSVQEDQNDNSEFLKPLLLSIPEGLVFLFLLDFKI